jgi:type II secretory pathway pseudopilin PulG
MLNSPSLRISSYFALHVAFAQRRNVMFFNGFATIITPGKTSGFSLVETIVSGAVTTVLAGVMFIILQMNNQGISNGAVNTRIQVQYQTVIDQIALDSRRATAILDGNSESWNAFNGGTFAPLRTNWIELYDNTGARIKGYKIEGTVLQEWINGRGYVPFLVGDVPVQVLGCFALAKDRKQDSVMLRVFSSFMNINDTTAARIESVISRN